MAVETTSAIFADFAVAFFDVLQSLRAQFEARFVFREKLRDARVEIPAEIIELRRSGEFFNFREGLRLDVREAEDDVRDLHAGVVDVVLHFDAAAGVAQAARHERVAKHGVAQVADVRGFIGIDAGVLDHDLAARPVSRRRRASWPASSHAARKNAARSKNRFR